MYLNHPCRLLRLCSLLVLCTLALGGCEMTRESNRIHQARRAANAERAAAEAEAKARLASGDVPAYWTWRDARTYYQHKHAIGEITVNGRPVLVTRFLKTSLWTGNNGDTLLDKYAALRANEGFLHSDLEPGRDGHSAEEDAERFRRPRSSRQCYDTREIPGALSVAFIDVDGVIVNIEELPPNYIVPQCSPRPVHQTLVMRSGWFAANGIQPGDTVTPFKSILVRELPGVLARHEHESAPAPVAWAHWNGWPLAHLTLSEPQKQGSARRERHLIITMPVQAPIKGEQEILARDDGYEAFHDAKLDREEALLAKLRERRQSPLRPWEGVLYPIHQQMYHDLVQSLDPCRCWPRKSSAPVPISKRCPWFCWTTVSLSPDLRTGIRRVHKKTR